MCRFDGIQNQHKSIQNMKTKRVMIYVNAITRFEHTATTFDVKPAYNIF